MKTFFLLYNIGRVKYVVNFSNGEKTHKDGSVFYDVNTFQNKKLRDRFIKKLKNDGYSEI